MIEETTVIRPWGEYKVINRGPGYLVKIITVKPGHRLSMQYHHCRKEHWFVIKGKAGVIKGNFHVETFVLEGQSVDIGILEHHRLSNYSQEDLILLEVQSGDILDENDIVRIEDDFGRLDGGKL